MNGIVIDIYEMTPNGQKQSLIVDIYVLYLMARCTWHTAWVILRGSHSTIVYNAIYTILTTEFLHFVIRHRCKKSACRSPNSPNLHCIYIYKPINLIINGDVVFKLDEIFRWSWLNRPRIYSRVFTVIIWLCDTYTSESYCPNIGPCCGFIGQVSAATSSEPNRAMDARAKTPW